MSFFLFVITILDIYTLNFRSVSHGFTTTLIFKNSIWLSISFGLSFTVMLVFIIFRYKFVYVLCEDIFFKSIDEIQKSLCFSFEKNVVTSCITKNKTTRENRPHLNFKDTNISRNILLRLDTLRTGFTVVIHVSFHIKT